MNLKVPNPSNADEYVLAPLMERRRGSRGDDRGGEANPMEVKSDQSSKWSEVELGKLI